MHLLGKCIHPPSPELQYLIFVEGDDSALTGRQFLNKELLSVRLGYRSSTPTWVMHAVRPGAAAGLCL